MLSCPALGIWWKGAPLRPRTAAGAGGLLKGSAEESRGSGTGLSAECGDRNVASMGPFLRFLAPADPLRPALVPNWDMCWSQAHSPLSGSKPSNAQASCTC